MAEVFSDSEEMRKGPDRSEDETVVRVELQICSVCYIRLSSKA